eukprot:8093613-Pyramimonas_sp.AAC.1
MRKRSPCSIPQGNCSPPALLAARALRSTAARLRGARPGAAGAAVTRGNGGPGGQSSDRPFQHGLPKGPARAGT